VLQVAVSSISSRGEEENPTIFSNASFSRRLTVPLLSRSFLVVPPELGQSAKTEDKIALLIAFSTLDKKKLSFTIVKDVSAS